ncbi:MAG: CopD family protein [Chloroflexota bacterium]
MPQSTILAISLFFHLLATVVWVGGLVITTILVWPEARRTLQSSPAFYTYLLRLRKRFTPWGNLSLAVLIVTGLFQMSLDENYNGFLDFSNQWSVVILMKHIALLGMIGCGTLLQFSIFPALERTTLLLEREKGGSDDWQKLRRREVVLTWVNVLLGIAVLGFSAWAGSL